MGQFSVTFSNLTGSDLSDIQHRGAHGGFLTDESLYKAINYIIAFAPITAKVDGTSVKDLRKKYGLTEKMPTFDDIQTLVKFVSDRDACSRRDIETITEAYFEAPLEQRREIFDQLTDKHIRSLAVGITTFCEFAIFDESVEPIWTVLVCMELSASKIDWRENLIKLLVFDHTLETLRSVGIDFDISEWKAKSKGTFNNFEQLNERPSSMRNIDSVEIKMSRYPDRVKFEPISLKPSGPFWS